MKKNVLIAGIALGLALFAGGCKSSKDSAYKTAYDQAKNKQVRNPVANNDVVIYTPPEEEVVVYTPRPPERLSPATPEDANYLKRYSIVIGSFRNKTNASSLKDEMIRHGYAAIIAQNEEKMYRVIISSYDDRNSAEHKRNDVRSRYAPRFDDIWILERLY
ncbi:MAG: SPOR domain-containing protein [Bacteroidales bacterium]|jgi:cell division protein FtsN|nr:SPOR domain-containing protein [Bacteroidales bacterium]